MKTDFYRTLDRIDNLRISVKLYKTQRNTSFSAVIGGKPGNDVLHDLADGGQGATERVLVAELEVPWQQKMESKPDEVYNICSYVDEECFEFTTLEDDTQNQPLLTFTKKQTTYPQPRHRISTLNADGLLVERNVFSNFHTTRLQDDFDDSSWHGLGRDIVKLGAGEWRTSVLDGTSTEMRIVASVTTTTNPILAPTHTDKQLCVLRFYSFGLLVTSPGFSSKLNSSSTKTQGLVYHSFKIGADTYEYTIECASEAMSVAEEQSERAIFEEFHARYAATMLAKATGDFIDFNKKGHAKVIIKGELLSGYGFDCTADWIYVEYLFQPDEAATMDFNEPGQLLSATSQVAEPNLVNEVLFGFPFEFSLICPAESLHAGDLYFKVYSVDTWDRHKIIGYGYHKLLIKPDSTTNQTAANIATWRPVTSHYHQLKTYFLGGSPEIDDVTYLKNQPSKNQQTKFINKYGFKTESSGTLSLRLTTLYQTSVERVESVEDIISPQQQQGGLSMNGRGAFSNVVLKAKARLNALRASQARQKSESDDNASNDGKDEELNQ